MTQLSIFEHSPFDILFRNFFKDEGFIPIQPHKLPHPVNIYQTEDHLVFEIACTGVDKDDIKISIQSGILKVIYEKEDTENSEHTEYLYRGIAKRSFNLGWKIDNKFNLNKADAEFKNGLLTVSIPYVEESQSKILKIR